MHHSNQLYTRQREFLKVIKSISSKVVARYVSKGVIPERERDDVERSIVEKFLIKKDKINSSFNGRAKITTYYTAVINRMCCEVIRQEQKHWYAVKDNEYISFPLVDATVSFDTAKQTLVREELNRLYNLIMLINGSHSKVLLFLKYYFDIPIQEDVIIDYTGCNKKEQALKILGYRKGLSKAVVTERLAELVLLVENKQVGGDAVRMWINKQIDTLVYRMNGGNKERHNKETIGIMLEMQFNR